MACVIAVDAAGNVRHWTKDAELVFGYATERIDGQPVQRLVPFLSSEQLEGWCRREDGSVFRGLIAVLPRADSEACQVFAVTDITSRYMRGEMRNDTRARSDDDARQLQVLLDTMSDGVLLLEPSGTIAAMNPAALGMFRLREPAVGAELCELLELSDAAPSPSALQEAIGRREDGSTFAVECRLSPLGDSGRTLAVVRDVTQRRSLERQVLDASEQLQRQIGQDLHDGLGQLLTGTAFLAKGLQHALAGEQTTQAQRIVELINLAIARVRSLARGLSPIHVEAQSLPEVLQTTLGEASELLGVACELDVQDSVGAAPPAVIAQLCLIAREAITNAVRHGHARNIVVRLTRSDAEAVLAVEDDGVGFDEVEKPLEGLGLRSMRYRAKMIDGKLDIVRTRSGTSVRCCWPDR